MDALAAEAEDIAPQELQVSPEDQAAAEDLKSQANDKFKGAHYHEAIDLYTQAIQLNGNTAVYYANRAAAHIKAEEYGSAMSDAGMSIKLQPTYIKGYYRRADAKLALGRFGPALKDFKLAAKVAPRDPDLKRKLAACEKEAARARFEKALRSDVAEESPSAKIVLEDIIVDESYTGPRMAVGDEGQHVVTHEFVTGMMKAFEDQKSIHRRFALTVLLQFQAVVKELPSLVDVDVAEGAKITVCGDTHGQFFDLLNILKMNGEPSVENPYVFNGDFVDRGSWSVEVILTLMAWKVLEPACVHLTRGNHEAQSLNKIYGFEGEVKAKYNATVMDIFRETFCWLPLAYCLKKKVLVLHGGLYSDDNVTLDDLRAIDRFREPPDSGIMCETLWSDPQEEPGRAPSKRGCGIQFGPDVTKAFLQRNGLELLVRSHEVKDGGYEVAHDGYCVTVFSAPNYCDNMSNKGAFITFNGADMVPHFTQFAAVPHPDVKPMAYANKSLFGFL